MGVRCDALLVIWPIWPIGSASNGLYVDVVFRLIRTVFTLTATKAGPKVAEHHTDPQYVAGSNGGYR
jgi:hypothetical protein